MRTNFCSILMKWSVSHGAIGSGSQPAREAYDETGRAWPDLNINGSTRAGSENRNDKTSRAIDLMSTWRTGPNYSGPCCTGLTRLAQLAKSR